MSMSMPVIAADPLWQQQLRGVGGHNFNGYQMLTACCADKYSTNLPSQMMCIYIYLLDISKGDEYRN
jgi:hypothetical protein